MKRRAFILFSFVLLALLFVFDNINVFKIYSMPENFYVGYDEISQTNKDNEFGRFVDLSMKESGVETTKGAAKEGEIVFKLFGLIPIKKVSVKILPQEEVFVGGAPLGFSVQTDGAVVISNSIVCSETSEVMKNKNFHEGDIIKQINGKNVHCIEDVMSALETSEEGFAMVKIQKENHEEEKKIPLIKDLQGGYKMGVWVRDNFSGIGTLTFVSKSDEGHKFGALGHPITNGKNENVLPICEGEVFSCSLVDILKGTKNNPGELRGVYVSKNKLGEFDKNTEVGVFGSIYDVEQLVDNNRTAKLGGRLSVKPGKAKIVSNVSGISEEYEIEIIKAAYQSRSSDKSLVFRVVDERLLNITGGIVQGMSGSPIMQDGKLVGAVTHVFVSDPTKGFGVYSDWMLEQIG